jgi:cobalamin biosynthesis protein CobT
MSDRELSTRDLAETAGEQEEASNQDTEEPRGDAGQPTETDAADEPMASERSESEGQTDVPAEADSTAEERGPLLSEDESERFTTRWREIQVGFVDEPRDSVAQADALVADLMQQLAASFSDERERLEKQWDSGDDVSTEDLRVALTRYRSFFDRLLSA